MKNISKIVSLILVLSLVSGLCTGIVFAETTYTWDDINTSTGVYITYDKRSMPFKPADKYVSMQNPPDFSWPYVNSATSYDLKICTDEAMTAEYKSLTGLTNNYYNFSVTFATGVNYYWSVRYLKNGVYSSWSDVRRFRIDPDAYEFTVPDIDTLLGKVSESHPRIFTTKENLSNFRSIKDRSTTSSSIYTSYVNSAASYAASGLIPPEPELNENYWDKENNTYKTGYYEEYLADLKACKTVSGKMLSYLLTAGFGYLLTGDEAIGDYAKKLLLSLSEWDVEGPTSYTFDDQIHREVVYKSAMVYDWINDRMDETEKKTVRDMIVERVTHVYQKSSGTSCMANLMTSLKKSPYDSHGWTAIGYLGITAYALMGDFGEEEDVAKNWLTTILPLYTAVMHPWSTEDGGWSQGTDYYRYSTESSKEFIDIMALGGVINYYNKAWANNERFWVMYAYPNGSYGSFGDQSNRSKAESASYLRNAMGKIAYFNDDALARWLSKEQGSLSSNMYNYYAGETIDGITQAPTDYPLGHEFDDIGWAVMTNDLEDTDRVQLTFKSSAYGSFNHSHADQNSFIIQAYGENLAIKSGYYDYYHSPHDVAITRPTFSHNSITVDGGYGQQDDRFNAKGNLSQFVNGLEFDSVTGEAADAYTTANYSGYAYGGNLDKFDRNIIYIRPDVFIVVDDLDASGDNTSSFEWWLNAEHEMAYDNTSATISEGDARLKADVLYPVTTATYYDTFTNPVNNTVYTPTSGYESKNVQTRVAFKTAEKESTKMVVTMSVYESTGSAKEPEVETAEDSSYIKLDYGDATVYVSLLDSSAVVETEDGISFKGAAVTLSDTTIMLTNGTYLEKDNAVLIDADRAVTASMGLGEICLSSDDDFNIDLDTMNDYLTVTDDSKLKDASGRALTSKIGITATHTMDAETDILTISAQKGNYTIINGDTGIVSPGQLGAENISVQKSGDGKAAVFWDKKDGRSYDIKVDSVIYEDVASYPYTFDVKADVVCVYVREKLGKIKGGWSEPLYVSNYERENHDKVTFSDITKDEKTYIKAETLGFPSYGFFDMYLAKYDGEGTLQEVVKGEASNSVYSAETEKPESGTVKAFLFGKDAAPLASTATYGNNSTDLLGIYADGELIEGFDNTKTSYELTFEKGRLVFPFITADVADNSSKAEIDYDFDNFIVTITVKAADGTKRTVTLKYSYDITDIHYVYKADEDTQPDLTADTGTVDANGNSGYRTSDKVGRLYYDTTDDEGNVTQTYKYSYTSGSGTFAFYLYTDMRGNSGGDLFGSRLFDDRTPNSGNHMEAKSVPDNLKGFDYFVLPIEAFFKQTPSTAYPNRYFWFRACGNFEVVVLSCVELDTLKKEGYTYGTTSLQGRYMNTIGPEDYFYNTTFRGLSVDDAKAGSGGGYYPKNYDVLTNWLNVAPLDEYTKYSEYVAAYDEGDITEADFGTPVGDASSIVVTSGFKYTHKYTKAYNFDKVSDVTINLNDVKSETDRIVIVVKPITPAPFYEK